MEKVDKGFLCGFLCCCIGIFLATKLGWVRLGSFDSMAVPLVAFVFWLFIWYLGWYFCLLSFGLMLGNSALFDSYTNLKNAFEFVASGVRFFLPNFEVTRDPSALLVMAVFFFAVYYFCEDDEDSEPLTVEVRATPQMMDYVWDEPKTAEARQSEPKRKKRKKTFKSKVVEKPKAVIALKQK